MIDEILSLVAEHEEWRVKRCLNLIPSENIMSPAVRNLLSSDLAHRYTSVDRFYMGTRFTDEIEHKGEDLAKQVFKADVADLRPLSGHIADLIVLANLTKQGDRLMCIQPEDGGYPGMWNEGLAGLLRLKADAMPFSRLEWNIKIDEMQRKMKKTMPQATIFGASLILFPHPVREAAKLAREQQTLVGFDGSHVMGLIAGSQFQDPLREGANVLFGSTHKSFFGPQGGIILADKEHGQILKEKTYPAFVDNAHWNRIAAMALALAEMKQFGKAYAAQVVKNSQALARALYDLGFPVIAKDYGFTKSHQTILDYGDYDKGRAVGEKLQQCNIIADCVVRIGTCEVTRRGMKEEEMDNIAKLLGRAVIDKERPAIVQKDVQKLCSDFQTCEYCFK